MKWRLNIVRYVRNILIKLIACRLKVARYIEWLPADRVGYLSPHPGATSHIATARLHKDITCRLHVEFRLTSCSLRHLLAWPSCSGQRWIVQTLGSTQFHEYICSSAWGIAYTWVVHMVMWYICLCSTCVYCM